MGTMNTVSLLVVLFAVAASAEDGVARKPKLFFVSTSVTTSTLNTGSICYVSSTTIASCGRRKRRAINTDGKLFPKDAATVELEPSQREQDASATAGGREGSCSTGSPPPPSQPPHPTPPHTLSVVSSALLLMLTFVDRPNHQMYIPCPWIILPNESVIVLQR